MISFNIAIGTLAAVAYIRNRDFVFSFSSLNLTTAEKSVLIIPSFLPLLSIMGMYIMNLTSSNIMLMVLFFLVPAYICFICFYNRRVPPRVYPIIIIMIGVALSLVFSLRSAHILGSDIHWAYDFFQATFQNLHWSNLRNTVLDCCLSITLLPSVFQSVLNTSGEYIFKVVYSLIFTFTPLCVYIISRRYVKELFAFLASFFFMSQIMFLWSAYSPRSVLGIFFFAFVMMVLLTIELKQVQRSMLFIIFMVSMIVSHYAASYIAFFLIIAEFLVLLVIQKFSKVGSKEESKGRELVSQSALGKDALGNILSLSMIGLLFVFIFFWYGQVTGMPYTAAVKFIETTIIKLSDFFILESRAGGNVPAVLGEDILIKDIPHKIEFVLTWVVFTYIAIGAIAMLKRVIFNHNSKKLNSRPIKANFEIKYLVMTLLCGALLVAAVALPYVGTGYGIQRIYTQVSVILSVSFVICGIILSEYLSKYVRVKPYLLILVVLIPYFFCVTGPMYQIFGHPRDITLNSQESLNTKMYIYDAESYAAKWLEQHSQVGTTIYAYGFSEEILVSQSNIPYQRISENLVSTYQQGQRVSGYTWLRYIDMIDGGLLTEYPDVFARMSKIYANYYSETYK